MSTLLLIVIYLAFISLGLPDTLLGVAWPTMRGSLSLPLEAAGIFTMITTLSTAFSSIVSGHIIKRAGTGRVTFISCTLTGSALLGYSIAPSLFWLLVLTVPLGLGAGAVDAGLNNYVAKHYSSRHMSWLHCFWGIGASLGPNIMTVVLIQANSWQAGYRTIGLIQMALASILLLSLPLWKIREEKREFAEGGNRGFATTGSREEKEAPRSIWGYKGILFSIAAFPLYTAIESGTGVWLGSFLVEGRGIAQVTAGIWVSMFYVSITAGRFLTGLITDRFTNRQMIRGGLLIAIAGAFLAALPIRALILPGIILAGLGCAPVFPCMIHETPRRFGNGPSEIITGYQVGTAYVGGVTIVPLFGLLAGRVSLEVIPVCILLSAIFTLAATEKLNRVT